ncbi:Kinase, NAK [Giardia muris]|uniref:Kinase, NAK n=1 Tax=Giardia muris TaxID=5742 RepID=A0A4Z1SN08_GIAMU|nr:Kinase, NAK [Giardia muris]|eukprot:TNJ27114.1 Kinase, NAK [Giardia muris]
MNRKIDFGGITVALGQELARGGSGIIYLGHAGDSRYAVKLLDTSTPYAYQDAVDEVSCHSRFSGISGVVGLYGVAVDGASLEPTPEVLEAFFRSLEERASYSRSPRPSKSRSDRIFEAYSLSASRGAGKSILVDTAPGPTPCAEVALLLEYCKGANCVKLLARCSERQVFLPEPLIWRIILRLAMTISRMHAEGWTHRDVKLENVLIADQYDLDDLLRDEGKTTQYPELLRLCDFGSASNVHYDKAQLEYLVELDPRALEELVRSIELCTTPCFRAPEHIHITPAFAITTQVDVFSFGILLYRLMYRRLPFPDDDLEANYAAVFQFQDKRYVYSDKLKDLVTCCLKQDPQLRITMEGIIFRAESVLHDEYGFSINRTTGGVRYEEQQRAQSIQKTAPPFHIPVNNLTDLQSLDGDVLDAMARQSDVDLGDISISLHSLTLKPQVSPIQEEGERVPRTVHFRPTSLAGIAYPLLEGFLKQRSVDLASLPETATYLEALNDLEASDLLVDCVSLMKLACLTINQS